MVFIISVFLALNSLAFASLQKINIKNLNLNYVYPQGAGTFEKLQLGIKSRHTPLYPVEVSRGESSFDLTTPFVDFSWLNPIKFVHDLASFDVKQLGLTLDKGDHAVLAEGINFTPQEMGEFSLESLLLLCSGESQQERIEDRLLEDCFKNLKLKIEKIKVPVNLVAPELPDTVNETDEIPGSDFLLNVTEGDFDLSVRIKYYLRARVSVWGHLALEENNEVIVIRVDRMKYGVMPVTTVVMNQLASRINHPKIEVKPPFIRIKLGK